MAEYQDALRTRLVSAVGDLIGQLVHWSVVPQDSPLPYVRLQTISDPRPSHLKGYDGARVTRVQCDCFAASHLEATGLAEAIIAALAVPDDVDGVRFGFTKAEGPRDLGEDTPQGFIHRASVDLLVEHS